MYAKSNGVKNIFKQTEFLTARMKNVLLLDNLEL